jgi:hypothetical protein
MSRKTLPKKISFAAFCRDVIGEPISRAWNVAYKTYDGEPLKPDEIETWRAMTGRDEYTPRAVHEMTAVKGRRAQGSKTACKFLVYKIHTGDFRRFAAAKDRLHVPVIAQTRETAREIMSYLQGFYEDSDVLRGEVAEVLKQSIELKNGFVISVQTCSYRAPRGITAPLALLDEVGVWRVEGADVDHEVVRSLTPAMVQFPSRKLILLGSPWTKSGVLFERFERRFENSDRLVLHCPTPLMNPSISPDELAREQVADPQNYRREFLAEWLDDVDQFLPDSDITAAVQTGVREVAFNPPLRGHYSAALDASGLTGADKFTLAIGHRVVRGSGRGTAFDALRGWSRAPVAQVCDEIAALLKTYEMRSVVADQFGFTFLRELLAQRGIEVRQLPFTARSKPEVMLELKTGLAQGRIALLDHTEALRELRMLESRRTSGGNYSIAAPRGAHDDFATVTALLVFDSKSGGSSGAGFIAVGGKTGTRIVHATDDSDLPPGVEVDRMWWRK